LIEGEYSFMAFLQRRRALKGSSGDQNAGRYLLD